MTPTLESLGTCTQGLLPAQLFTCSSDGVPNAAYLSHVDYVDPQHVALSFQFFNTSRRNIAENPRALVIVQDPDTGQGWGLRLRYVRPEDAGPLFDRMALRIEAIASYCGLEGIFKLRAADVYEVLSIELIAEEEGLVPTAAPGAGPDPVFTVNALQDLSTRINRVDSHEALVDSYGAESAGVEGQPREPAAAVAPAFAAEVPGRPDRPDVPGALQARRRRTPLPARSTCRRRSCCAGRSEDPKR